ncbi:MAG: hypothetical protein WCJ33_03725 [Pseudomonadota bacterium]
MLIIIDFIRSNWRALIAGLFSLMILQQHIHINQLKNKITQTEAENISVIASNKRLADSVIRQNHAIENLQIENDKKAKNAIILLRKAKQKAKEYQNYANQVLAQKSTGNDCKYIINLIYNYIK